jgi:hypothetical protein
MYTSNPGSKYYNPALQAQPTGIEKVAAGGTTAPTEEVEAAQDYLKRHPEAVTFPDYGYGPTAMAGVPHRPASDSPPGSTAWSNEVLGDWFTWGTIAKIGAAGLIGIFLANAVRK